MGQTYGEYLKEMKAGMPDTIRLDLGHPITAEVIGREFGDAWKDLYGDKLESWAKTLEAHRADFQRMAKVAADAINRPAMLDALKDVAACQQRIKEVITPIAGNLIPVRAEPFTFAPRTRPAANYPSRDLETDTFAELVAEKLYAKMVSRGSALVPKSARPAPSARRGKSPIESIVLVQQPKSSRYLVVLNDEYDRAIPVDGDQKAWGFLFRIIEGERMKYDENRSHVDYLTTNRRSKIYAASGLGLTKFLGCESGLVKVLIKGSVISEKAYKQRLRATATKSKVT